MPELDPPQIDVDPPPAAPAFPEPIGTPPRGGRWTWNVDSGVWVCLDELPPLQE